MNTINKIIIGLFALLVWTACSPDDDHSLGGSVAEMPSNWNITATDVDNEVVVNFDPLTMIDGANITAVQFLCPEAGIDMLIKDAETLEIRRKVYKSGEYTLYVAPINRAGTGIAKEVKFNVVKNLLLESLSRELFKEEVQLSGETFYKTEMYIEENSTIALTGEMANEDVVINLDYFQRTGDASVQFLAASGVYNLLYSPTRKIVMPQVEAPDYPNFLIAIGKGFAYPSKISPAYTSTYPQWGMSTDVLSYMLYRRIADKTYQVTAMLKSGDGNLEFKGYHAFGGGRLTNDWANGGEYKYDGSTFSGVRDVFAPASDGNNWVAGSALDETQLYRVTITITGEKTSANVKVEIVNWNGEVQPYTEEPEEPTDPDMPIISTSIDPTTGKSKELDGETVIDIFQTLEKDAIYTLKGAMTNALFNLDFFENTESGKVKFLGENGDYHLIFNPIRNNVIIEAIEPAYPDFAFLCGVGLGYPTRTPQSVISKIYPGKQIVTLDNWNFDNAYEYILMRKTGDNIYQATIMLPSTTKYWWDGGPYASFKVYKAANTEAANEVGGKTFADGGGFTGTATDVLSDFSVIADDGNIAVTTAIAPKAVRMTVDLNSNTMTINNFDLP